MEYDNIVTHKIDFYIGKPKSGKTRIAGSYPKPLLYISIGNDGGGKVLLTSYPAQIKNGDIKVKNLRNDMPVNGKIAKTSIEKLAGIFAELRKPDADQFKTIVIDTVGAMQDDYKAYLEFAKGGRSLSQQEWGDVAKMMINIKDNMKRFSEEKDCTIVWVSHTSEQEVYETSGLAKEIRIVPDLTIKTGVKYMKDASNIFYCCRKTILKPDGQRDVEFLTYVGPHPLIDTGTRDILLEKGDFVKNFSYVKFQEMITAGKLDTTNVITPDIETEKENKNNDNEEN